jgi:hypothetical protein
MGLNGTVKSIQNSPSSKLQLKCGDSVDVLQLWELLRGMENSCLEFNLSSNSMRLSSINLAPITF